MEIGKLNSKSIIFFIDDYCNIKYNDEITEEKLDKFREI